MATKQLPCLVSNSWVRNNSEAHLIPNWVVAGSREGSSVYAWRSKIRSGVNAGSPYTLDRLYQESASPAAYTLKRGLYVWNGSSFVHQYADVWTLNGYPGNLTNYGVAQFAHLVGISATAEAEALTKVYDRIRQDAYGANGLLFLGELRETIHMLRHPLDSAQKLVNSYLDRLKFERIKAKRLKQKRSETKEALYHRKLVSVHSAMSGSWLELQFGIKPFVQDAKDIIGAVSDHITQPARRSRVSGKSAEAEVSENTSTDWNELTLLNGFATTLRVSKSSVRYVVGLRHTLDGLNGQRVQGLQERLGFQFQNFVPTIYELIPYSFLLDYFLNLGDVISAVCTDTTDVFFVSRTARQETRVIRQEWLKSYSEPWTNGTWHVDGEGGQAASHRSFRHLTVSRTIPETLPVPPLVLSVPGTDSTKWVNMAALIGAARDFRFKR